MVDGVSFLAEALDLGIGLFCGVPDSLLREFVACVDDLEDRAINVVVANEGAGVALAAGHHLATGGLGLVYMQNSGLGNAVNPLLSLTSRDVYSIPLLLLIGWRGEPGTVDEPQHLLQGRVTVPLLNDLEIPYRVLPSDTSGAIGCLRESVKTATAGSRPEAIIVRRDTFETIPQVAMPSNPYVLTREGAIALIVDQMDVTDVVVASTGKISRELYEYRKTGGVRRSVQDFLTVGSMGHASQIALGIALGQPERRVYCLDGDGALIMHMGALAILGLVGSRNFTHIVLNNGCHESVGGQPTAGFDIDIPLIAKACGFHVSTSVSTERDLRSVLANLSDIDGPHMLEVRIARGSREDLGRPQIQPSENKYDFMRFMKP